MVSDSFFAGVCVVPEVVSRVGLHTAQVAAGGVVGSDEGRIISMWEEFKFTRGFDVHFWVYRDGVDLDAFAEEVAEWEGGGRGCVPDALLLCCREGRVAIGDDVTGEVEVGKVVRFKLRPEGAKVGAHGLKLFLLGSPSDMMKRGGDRGGGL